MDVPSRLSQIGCDRGVNNGKHVMNVILVVLHCTIIYASGKTENHRHNVLQDRAYVGLFNEIRHHVANEIPESGGV